MGDPAPDLAFRKADGGTVRLASLRGRIVVVEFTSLGCATCRDLSAAVEALSARQRDVVFLTVSVDPPEALPRLAALRRRDARTALVRDEGGALGRLGSATTPTMVVIARDGRFASHLMQGGAGDLPRLRERIAWARKRP